MLVLFRQIDTPIKEVNMRSKTPTLPPPMYQLVDRELMAKLMERTGDGKKVSHRALAEAAGCAAHSTIGFLLDGTQESVPMDVAHGITRRLGVGVLVLFQPPHGSDAYEALLQAVGA
jgi:hypothetical protein